MSDRLRDAYSAFAEDHREFGVPKTGLAPTLRLKAIVVALAIGVAFWGAVAYFLIG